MSHTATNPLPVPTAIHSLDDVRIAPYLNLREASTRHADEQIFITEGIGATRKLLASSLELVSVFALPTYYDRSYDKSLAEFIHARVQAGTLLPTQMLTAEKSLMNEIVGFRLHTGVMAIGKQPRQASIEEMSDAEIQALMATSVAGGMPLVALNKLTDAENVGALVRNCAAFGVRTLLVDERSCSPYLRRAVRVSMGGIFALKIATCLSLPKACERLRNEAGAHIVVAEILDAAAAKTEPRRTLLPTFQFPARCVLIFGEEGRGIEADVLAEAESIVEIPMIGLSMAGSNMASSSMANTANAGESSDFLATHEMHHSLNVAAASAVMLYVASSAAMVSQT